MTVDDHDDHDENDHDENDHDETTTPRSARGGGAKATPANTRSFASRPSATTASAGRGLECGRNELWNQFGRDATRAGMP